MESIRQAEWDQDRPLIRDLFWEYLEWVNVRAGEEYGIQFEVLAKLEQDLGEIEQFLPPQGRMLLVMEDERPVGIGCLRSIGADMGEIKRMYVSPACRGRGLGRALLEALLAQAREMGFCTVRLDSPRFMHVAHALYRSAGFGEVDPYAESEIPPEFWQYWVFMEKGL
jgi:GNAT superfamily N-acetyltransferase